MKRNEYRPTGYFVFREYGDLFAPTLDTWPIEFATEAEAEATKARLEAGGDISFFDINDDDRGSLYVAKHGENF